jgi:hypothetical protein
MERLFETAISLAQDGRTFANGMPKPLDLALFVREFECEVQAAFPPPWVQQIMLAPLAWIAERRGPRRPRAAPHSFSEVAGAPAPRTSPPRWSRAG